MIEFATALGLVLVIEGLLYASIPGTLKRVALQIQGLPDNALRMAGVAVVAAGVALIWIIRSISGGS